MLLRVTPGRILSLNAVARMITCHASALLPSGFSRANLHWCRKISQRTISTWLASRRSQSRPPHAYQWCPCPWIGQWIRLQDSFNPDLLPLLKMPMTNNEALLLLPHFGSRTYCLSDLHTFAPYSDMSRYTREYGHASSWFYRDWAPPAKQSAALVERSSTRSLATELSSNVLVVCIG